MDDDHKIDLPLDYILLKVLKAKADSDPEKYAVLAALEGLSVIAGCWRGYGSYKGPEPPDWAQLPVPRWIFDTLGCAWITHRKSAPSGKTFGETLGIEGGGQGRKPAKDRWNQYLRDLTLAHEVLIEKQTSTYEEATSNVAGRHGVGKRTVQRAWTEHGSALQAAAESHDNTS